MIIQKKPFFIVFSLVIFNILPLNGGECFTDLFIELKQLEQKEAQIESSARKTTALVETYEGFSQILLHILKEQSRLGAMIKDDMHQLNTALEQTHHEKNILMQKIALSLNELLTTMQKNSEYLATLTSLFNEFEQKEITWLTNFTQEFKELEKI